MEAVCRMTGRPFLKRKKKKKKEARFMYWRTAADTSDAAKRGVW